MHAQRDKDMSNPFERSGFQEIVREINRKTRAVIANVGHERGAIQRGYEADQFLDLMSLKHLSLSCPINACNVDKFDSRGGCSSASHLAGLSVVFAPRHSPKSS